MALFEWQPSYEIGVEVIDQQHQQLVDIINNLHKLLEHSNEQFSANAFDSLLQRLFDYTRYHFTTEEDLMAESGYPEDQLHKHKRQHQRFIAELNASQLDIDSLTRSDAEIIQAFLVNWLQNHILKVDTTLIPFLVSDPETLAKETQELDNTRHGVGNSTPESSARALSLTRVQTWSVNSAMEELTELAEYACRKPHDFAQDKQKQSRLAYLAHKLKLDLSALLK
jgi:hemerythrin